MNTLASPGAIANQPDGSVGDSETVKLRIGGMTCQHCPPTIEKALRAVGGVTSASVNFASKTARVEYDPARAKLTDILQTIRKSGYTVGTVTMRVPIKNMHCSSCVIRVELALQMTPGVVAARASLGPNAVDIEYQPLKTDFDEIRNSIQSAGYRVAEPKIEPTDEVLDRHRNLNFEVNLLGDNAA